MAFVYFIGRLRTTATERGETRKKVFILLARYGNPWHVICLFLTTLEAGKISPPQPLVWTIHHGGEEIFFFGTHCLFAEKEKEQNSAQIEKCWREVCEID